MNSGVLEKAKQDLSGRLREAAIAQVGGFRPPETVITSFFGGQGVGLPGEKLPMCRGRDMFPLISIRIDELPVVPPALSNIAMLVVFMNREQLPVFEPHGTSWLIREYHSLEHLGPLAKSEETDVVKPFPIRWHHIQNDAPCWEDLSEVVEWPHQDEGTYELYETFKKHEGTKIGGYPFVLQGGVGVEGFVFQVDSEPKAGWAWGDNGIGYFHKRDGVWRLDWQCL